MQGGRKERRYDTRVEGREKKIEGEEMKEKGSEGREEGKKEGTTLGSRGGEEKMEGE